jgi:uncharacterized membrane protein
MGDINSSDRKATTLYSLGKWVVSGIYVQIPCIQQIVMIIIIIIIIIIISNILSLQRYYSVKASGCRLTPLYTTLKLFPF